MNLSSLRPSFQIAVVMRNHDMMVSATNELSEAGYIVKCFEGIADVKKLKSGWLPHMLIINLNESHDLIDVVQFKATYPEIKVIGLFLPLQISESGKKLFVHVDALCREDYAKAELLLAVDKNMQAIYLEQINESLALENDNLRASESVNNELNRIKDEEKNEVLNLEALQRLLGAFHSVTDHREAIENYFDWFGGRYKSAKIVWFSFIQRQHAFSAVTGRNISQSLRGLGFKVSRHHAEILNQNASFEDLLELQDFVQSLFGPEAFSAHPVFVKNNLIGLMVVIGTDSNLEQEKQTANLSLMTLKNYLDLLYHRDKLYQYLEYDIELGMLDKRSFQKRMITEVGRARRNRFPLSMVLVGFEKKLNHRVTKALIRLLTKELNSFDFVGAWGEKELAVLLPHTGNELAAAKADKLRQLFHSVKVIGPEQMKARAHVSFGVSEYPRCSSDAEDLAATCIEALQESQKIKGEQVVLAALVNERESFLESSKEAQL